MLLGSQVGSQTAHLRPVPRAAGRLGVMQSQDPGPGPFGVWVLLPIHSLSLALSHLLFFKSLCFLHQPLAILPKCL